MKLVSIDDYKLRLVNEIICTSDPYLIYGKVLDLDVPTKFGNKIYSSKLFKNILENIKHREHDLLGELRYERECYYDYVDISNVSHKIVSISIINGSVFAQAVVLDTESGKLLKISNLSDYRFCLRGTGIVIDNNIIDEYELITIDILKDNL